MVQVPCNFAIVFLFHGTKVCGNCRWLHFVFFSYANFYKCFIINLISRLPTHIWYFVKCENIFNIHKFHFSREKKTTFCSAFWKWRCVRNRNVNSCEAERERERQVKEQQVMGWILKWKFLWMFDDSYHWNGEYGTVAILEWKVKNWN